MCIWFLIDGFFLILKSVYLLILGEDGLFIVGKWSILFMKFKWGDIVFGILYRWVEWIMGCVSFVCLKWWNFVLIRSVFVVV